MYLTFEEYQNYGGQLTSQQFNTLEFKARACIDERTFGRLKKAALIPDAVKLLTFELVNLLSERQQAQDPKRIKSESNDGFSQSYVDGLSAKEYDAMIEDLIRSYLINEKINGVPLLYLGV